MLKQPLKSGGGATVCNPALRRGGQVPPAIFVRGTGDPGRCVFSKRMGGIVGGVADWRFVLEE